jgi:hypothetical protein
VSELHDAIRRAMEAQGEPEPEPVPHPVETTNDVQEIPPAQATLFDHELEGGEPPEPGMVRAGMPDPARNLVGRYHRSGGDTERAAATLVAPRSGTQRATVLEHLRACGEDGCTDYEMWQANREKFVRPHVPGTRREELIADGWAITDSGARRLTDTGSPAIVWTLVE